MISMCKNYDPIKNEVHTITKMLNENKWDVLGVTGKVKNFLQLLICNAIIFTKNI
jgi:hypothetical protein